MDYDQRIKYIIIGLFLLCSAFVMMSLSIAGFEAYRLTEEAEKNVEEVVIEEENNTDKDISIFDTFEETTEQKLLETINFDAIKAVARDTSTGDYYIIDSNDKKYRVTELSLDTINYIRMLDIKITDITIIDEEAKTAEKKEESLIIQQLEGLALWQVTRVLIVIMICLIVYDLIRTRAYIGFPHRSASPITNSNSDNKSEDKNEKSTVKTLDGKEIPKVRFNDVEGIEGLKQDIFRIVDCVKNPEKYERAGARIPKGIILYGPPGTGKTLLAKAIAGEAGVPFLAAVGSDFVEKYVGTGARRVRELFAKARRQAPCIVFIDEVDAVACKRGEDDNSERDQTINAFLSELDGFGSASKVITICATNRLDILDDAFMRAGRFDLKLAVSLPDKQSRERILKIHSKNKLLSDEIDLEVLATRTAGFSGADLEALLNEAAMLAAEHNQLCIIPDNIDDAFFKIVMQGNKKKREEITEMNKIIAWHESGHTLATKLLTNDSVNSVTIVGSSSGAGGVTFRTPQEGLQSKKYLKNSIAIMYAGRAAEEIYLNDSDEITTGASQDIKQATSIIKQYLALYGMGNVGMIDLTQLNRDFNNIVSEATQLSKEIYEKTLKILRDNKNILEELANRLLEKETLDEKEIDKIIGNHKKCMEVLI